MNYGTVEYRTVSYLEKKKTFKVYFLIQLFAVNI